jgi:hypothetical protein
MCGQGGQTSTQKGHTRHIQEDKAYMGIVKRLVNIEKKSREDEQVKGTGLNWKTLC